MGTMGGMGGSMRPLDMFDSRVVIHAVGGLDIVIEEVSDTTYVRFHPGGVPLEGLIEGGPVRVIFEMAVPGRVAVGLMKFLLEPELRGQSEPMARPEAGRT